MRTGAAAAAGGLLVVRSQVAAPLHARYHAWYDNEHVPARIRRPGWLTARRYVAVHDQEMFLACYDLANLAVLQEPSYVRLRTQRSVTEQRVLARIGPMDRRIYRPAAAARRGPAELDTCGALLLCVWWQPAPAAVDAFHDWYDQEHLPLLSRIPGWLRARRFELVDGAGPAYLAMHDLASADVFDHPGYAHATSTARRAAVVAGRVSYERVLYRLIRRFDPAPVPQPD
jgi:hypothetical protein